ncbi:MAG TPA: ABC transporter ATP-binding protein [Smithellaceae bacterium]|nr:ABC transporter ATP-binding protein [Smithellaceae bacterium]HOM69705.1 ABC transporter ATP-binding protein [Smithellaceae bacterium]HOS10157.1 ABC transporter ATP-binding protein [Smithellaceae bacterium]HOU05376.1 ABC transporter ATP-binding protein [Smithellaceae bacterium]HPD49932.1 ABC transporter ATP-binding protein [Smithellaceae bacterium]
MIDLINLTKDFGTTVAVNNLSLHVSPGEIYGFIGPNGAGKTTTIRMMAGIVEPSSGKIIIDGMDMKENPVAVKKIIGIVPDRPFLYEKLTGAEFLKFIADIYEVDAKTMRQRSDDLLRQFALWDWANEIIEAYSHGMKQRLIIAAALMHHPKVLVVDEPMVGLDPSAVRMVKDIFKDLAVKNVAIFVSTHTLSIAEDLCDRIGVIHKGNLVAQGTMDELNSAAQTQKAKLEEVFLALVNEA